MQLTVLGPLEVVSEGERVPLGGPKQRLVLGMLAASRRRVVTFDELIDGLWPEGPQAQPRKTVQVYVTRLRNALGASGAAIRSEAAGYRLDTELLPVDADEFEADVRHVTDELDDEAAITLLRRALSRWRGDAFVDLRDCPSIVPSAVGLDELRLRAQHELFEHEVRMHPRAVISELEHAVEQHPLDEGFAALLMTAQYRAGRQVDALATYQTLRARLGEELGLEPGRAIRELEGQILRHELPVAAPPAAAAAPERQRRRVTVLAADIVIAADADDDDDGGLDPEEELAIVAPLRQAARTQILHGGGVVLADAGRALTACFGYPAGERSPDAAVRVALAIRDLVDATEAARAGRAGVRFGIDTGVVIVELGREGGGPADLTGIAGEPLRTAVVLRDRAGPGEALVSDATAAAVSPSIGLAVTSAGSVAATAADHPGEAEGAQPRLVGRDAAMRDLVAFAADRAHRWCTVVVAGPPGVGKTALVDEFVATLDPRSPTVRARGDRRHGVIPLHPFTSLLPELFAGDEEPTPREVVAALVGGLGDVSPGHRPDECPGHRPDEIPGHGPDPSPVLVVDDVDAVDPSTLDVLADLQTRLPRGLLLLTSRSTEPFDIAGEAAPAIVLAPLDHRAARTLAASIAGERRLSLAMLNEIAERSGGVPLYVEALARAAADNGTTPSPVPASVYDSLMAQLDRLGASRAAIQRCAVLGEAFADEDLALLGDEHGGIPGAALATAVGHGVLVADGEGRYRFTHHLTAAAAYESMLLAERAALHARVADALVSRPGRAEPELLASHFEAAGRLFDAAVSWRRASSKAIRASRDHDAQEHARRALRLFDRLGADEQPDGGDNRRRALVNLAVGTSATSHGSAELNDVIDRLRREGLEQADPGRAVVIGLIDVGNQQALGNIPGAEAAARATVSIAERLGDPNSVAIARHFHGATLVWSGQLVAGVAELDALSATWELDAARAASSLTARTYGALWSLLGLAAELQDRAADATAHLDRAWSTIGDDGYAHLLVGSMTATADQLAGRDAEVRARCEPLWSLAMDLSSDFWIRWVQSLLGWAIAAEAGDDDWRNGIAMMTEVVDDKGATRQAAPYFAYLLGSRLSERGRFAEGVDRLDAGLGIVAETGEALWAPLLHLGRAACLGEAGDAAARVAAEAAHVSAQEMGAALIAERSRYWLGDH